MDILHKESVNGFCIVSSDSDYTRLASRIRESGREVLGFGEKKTPKPFIKSCDKFIYVEILGQPAAPTPALAPAPGPAPAATQSPAAKAAQKKTSAKRRQTSDTQVPGTPEAAAAKKPLRLRDRLRVWFPLRSSLRLRFRLRLWTLRSPNRSSVR